MKLFFVFVQKKPLSFRIMYYFC